MKKLIKNSLMVSIIFSGSVAMAQLGPQNDSDSSEVFPVSSKGFVVKSMMPEEKLEFTYVKDVVVEGKEYVHYQTQSHDDILASKDSLKKRGVYWWFGKARKALSREGMFQFGFGFGRTQLSQKQISADRAAAQATLGPNWAPGGIALDPSNREEILKSSGGEEVFVSYRPHFYRTLRISAGAISGNDHDQETERKNVEPDISGYVFAVEHDLYVLPVGENAYLGFAAGYFFSKHKMSYGFHQVNPEPGTKYLDLSTSVDDRVLRESGYTASVRVVVPGYDVPDLGFMVTAYMGRQGNRRITGQLSIGFGNKDAKWFERN
ncbi:MAG: hypothetical protein AB7F59_11645 [Bdellovibrionales bacterium]